MWQNLLHPLTRSGQMKLVTITVPNWNLICFLNAYNRPAQENRYIEYDFVELLKRHGLYSKWKDVLVSHMKINHRLCRILVRNGNHEKLHGWISRCLIDMNKINIHSCGRNNYYLFRFYHPESIYQFIAKVIVIGAITSWFLWIRTNRSKSNYVLFSMTNQKKRTKNRLQCVAQHFVRAKQ